MLLDREIDEDGSEFRKWLLETQPKYVICRMEDGFCVEYEGAETQEELSELLDEFENRPGEIVVYGSSVIQ